MASTIKIKRSGVAGKQPNTSTISVGELAINFKDQKLYSSNGSTIFQIGGGSGGGSSNGFSGILVGSNVVVADSSTDRLTFVAGSRVTIAANPTSDTITFAAQTADYLQVSNAAVIYQTKAVERAALANTNASIATQANRITLVNTNLTGTNTALRTLISDRYQVANVNTLLAAKATWAGLTGTNTALRTLISDRLQVANAATIYQTRAVERAALANTNASIATQANRITLVNTNLTGTNTALRTLINGRATWTALTGTNTALRTLISDRLQVANAATLYATKISPTTSGLLAHTGRATISTNLAVSGNTTLGAANKIITSTGLISHTGRATISTNLSVSGNTTLSGTLVANGTSGTSGHYLRTSGSGIYWSPVAAEGGSNVVVTTNFIKNLTPNSNVVTSVTQFSGNVYSLDLSGYVTTATFTSTIADTNTAIRTLVSDRLQVANAATLYATKISPTTSGVFAHTGRATISTNLTVSGNTILGAANKTITTTGLISHTGRATISTNLTVSGNSALGLATGTSFNSITGLASVAPVVAGTAAVGVSTLTARQDHVHPAQTSVTGNAGTATTLQTARAINGTDFNGSAAITTANWGTARTVWGQSINGSVNITAPLLPAAGTAALPAFSTSGDTNTGMFFPAADTIAFAEGGVEAMRIDSSGNVGIGTSSPGSKLDVSGEIRDQSGNVRSVPQNAQTAAYTLIASDNGKHISITTGGITVPSGVFAVGDTVTIYNNSASNQTITQGGSVTLRQVGTATTGNRTLAQRGLATVLCVASNEFVITGGGLT